MAYKGMCVHDVTDYDDYAECCSQVVYFDFDTEDEAYEFGRLLEESRSIDALVREIARRACEKKEW